MAWAYTRDDSKGGFAPLPEGKYRIRVKSVEKAVSKSSGNDMLSFQFEVSGKRNLLFHYITFLMDKPDVTNRMLTQFFDSFKGIEEGDFNLKNWIGKVGACVVKHEDYNGSPSAKISYFIKADKQGDLPAWQEPPAKDDDDGKEKEKDFAPIPDDEEVPFF